jgi:methionyl-tRNA formyltransferase
VVDKLSIHLYSTDASALALVERVQVELTAIVVPENRVTSGKVSTLRQAATVPVLVQPRNSIPAGLPHADAAVVWLYSQVFPPSLLERYPRSMLNMHGGRIPEYRGANVLQWAIINGETSLVVTWHQIVEIVDAGPIWAEGEVPIRADTTAWDLRQKMIDEGVRLFPGAWKAMQGGNAPLRIPDISKGRVWPQRKPADGRIGPAWPEAKVRDMVRALCPPWPPATVAVDEGQLPVAEVLSKAERGTIPYRTTEGGLIHLRLASGK